MGQDTVRAFVALELDEGTKGCIAAMVQDLRPRLLGVRWVSPEQLHLTLRFLGDVSIATLERLKPRLREAVDACPAIQARVSGVGMFPERGAPRVLWLGLDLPREAFRLQAACENAVVAVGAAPERRPFRAHVTLGRWRERAPRPEVLTPAFSPVDLRRVVLFRSDLRPSGATHTPLAVYALGSAAS